MGYELSSTGLKSAPTSLVSTLEQYIDEPSKSVDIKDKIAHEREREKHGAYPTTNAAAEQLCKNEDDGEDSADESGSDDGSPQPSPVKQAPAAGSLIDLLDMGTTASATCTSMRPIFLYLFSCQLL